MNKNKLLAIDGVFLAVKCDECGTVYSATDGDYLAFFGSVSVGLSSVILGVDPPRKPAKKAMRVVCRTPSCVGQLVKKMLGCDTEDGDFSDERWAQILNIWATNAGQRLVSSDSDPTPTLGPRAKLQAKKRAS